MKNYVKIYNYLDIKKIHRAPFQSYLNIFPKRIQKIMTNIPRITNMNIMRVT